MRTRRTDPVFTTAELAHVRRFYSAELATPLHHLRSLASSIGIGDLMVKDETSRFGLPAFKILGVRYAVARLVESGAEVTDVACATAGNHGRAVARVARERGLEAHVYVPIGTSPPRIAALRDEHAHVVVTTVDYDDTVRAMARDAEAFGWTIVSDTAWAGYETIPRWIMAGYTQLMDEAASQWGAAPPDLIVVQAGVGSLAGAVAGWLVSHETSIRSKYVVVEPDGSACVKASLDAGRLQRLEASAPTSMVGLRCAEVSPLAWPAIAAVADGAMTVSDAEAQDAINRLAAPLGDLSPVALAKGDPAIEAGPSGAAGVAAVLALASRADLASLRSSLGWGLATRAFVIVTEGPSR